MVDTSILSLLIDNPFRILGVCSNASLREITSNANKIKTYLKVNKNITFPLDLNDFLPPIVRTEESVNNALSQLNNPIEKYAAALFWFAKFDINSEIILNHVSSGDLGKAEELTKNHLKGGAKIQNQFMLSLLRNDFLCAIKASSILSKQEYVDLFAQSICGDNFTITSEKVKKIYIDSFLRDISLRSLRDFYSDADCDDEFFIVDSMLKNEYVSAINQEIQIAKEATPSDAMDSLNAAKRLVKNTKTLIEEFEEDFSNEDEEYCLIAGKLAEQILQCSINFYNSTSDKSLVTEAIELTRTALNIAEGEVKIKRIQHNLNILKEIQVNLPPKEFTNISIKVDNLVKKLYDVDKDLSFVRVCINEAARIVVSFKEILEEYEGNDKERLIIFYRKSISKIAHTILNVLIEIVNVDSSKTTSREAYKLMILLEKFDTNADFKKRYTDNERILNNNISSTSLFLTSGLYQDARKFSTLLMTEKELFLACKTKVELSNYLEKYPCGKYANEARLKILEIEKREDEQTFQNCTNTYDYIQYLENFPQGLHREKAKQLKKSHEEKERNEVDSCKSISELKIYLAKYPHPIYQDEVTKLIKQLQKQRNIWLLISYVLLTANILLAVHLFIPHIFTAILLLEILVTGIIAFCLGANYLSSKDDDTNNSSLASSGKPKKIFFKTIESQKFFLRCVPIITVFIGVLVAYFLRLNTYTEDIIYFDGIMFGLAFGLILDYIFVKIKDYGTTTSIWLFWIDIIFIIVLVVRLANDWEIAFYTFLGICVFLIYGLFKSLLR